MAGELNGAADADAQPTRTETEIRRRIANTALLVAIALATTYVPAPGVNLAAMAAPDGNPALNTDALSRLSITALWLTPVVSALLLTEALKLVVPPQSALAEKNRTRRASFTRFMIVAALLLAAFQACGMTVALESIQATGGIAMVEEPGTWFRITYMATQVAGVALLIALADQITRQGIGSGLWVLIVAGELSGLGSTSAMLMSMYQSGVIHGGVILAALAVIIAAIAATVALYRAYVRPAGGIAGGTLTPDDLLIPRSWARLSRNSSTALFQRSPISPASRCSRPTPRRSPIRSCWFSPAS